MMLRKHSKLALFSLGLFSLISSTVNAGPTDKFVVVAPQCLIKQTNGAFKTLSSVPGFSLLEVNDAGIKQLIVAKHKRTETPCGGFMDVTTDWQGYKAKNRAKSFLINETAEPKSLTQQPKEYSINYPDQVNQLMQKIDSNQMWTDLATLSNFHDRNATTDNGVEAAKWIKKQVETLAKDTGHKDVTVTLVDTNGYKQPSVVAKFGNSSEPGIVIGSHMDTTASIFPTSKVGREPGADDDGSGSVTNLAIARTLLSSGMQFKKPIYFIWYAAEEQGLKGSRDVVAKFVSDKTPVEAVLQFDMTGYANKGDLTIWMIEDNVNPALTAYLKTLVETYLKPIKADTTRCGYACSDHASWHKKGYVAAFPFEAAFNKDNPNIHSKNDVMDILSREHVTNFAKLGVAFAVELAQPVS